MTTNPYLALSNPDRVAIVDHLVRTGKPASNRELADLTGRSEGWTRQNLVILADAGLIVRTPDTDRSAVRNSAASGLVWPMPVTLDQCRVLATDGRPDIMDLIARDGRVTVTDAAAILNISQPQASKHLKALVAAGLVSVVAERNQRWHSIADGIVWPVPTHITSEKRT